MSRFYSVTLLSLSMLFCSGSLRAQMPFYTDDSAVTEPGKFHVEVFDEIDGLQSSQFPGLRQNTANLKLNFSPVRHLELDVDAPYLAIYRTPGSRTSRGVGDTNLGAKWNMRESSPDSRLPAFAASLYIEFPTGDARQELGSGLTNILLSNKAWDPYPFILLNLFLSMLAAIQAPVIMMSQNRQDTKDRLRGELDFDVNRRAASDIQGLARKLNMLDEKIDDVSSLLRGAGGPA
jgi:hypothetical protein